jgi:hypothetical protein
MEPEPGPRQQAPGERRLARPPSDRYRAALPEPEEPDRPMSTARGVGYGLAAAIGGALAIVLLGGVLAVSAGLLIIAGASGWAVGAGIRAGGGATLLAPRRWQLAVILAIASVLLGQLGLWLYAQSEGGVLGVVDYLGETFGLLVPLQLLVATVVARISSR